MKNSEQTLLIVLIIAVYTAIVGCIFLVIGACQENPFLIGVAIGLLSLSSLQFYVASFIKK